LKGSIMQWGSQQDDCLLDVMRFLQDPSRQIYRLFGFAGTGKTTLAKEVASRIDGLVLFMAFSGKAAHVLHQKGCVGATTIHSVIYHTRDKGRAKVKALEERIDAIMQRLIGQGATNNEIRNNRDIQKLQKELQVEQDALDEPFFILNHDSEMRDAALAIIDEVSMVDGRLGEDLLSFGTKVLVLGDPAQLPPVKGTGFFTSSEPDFMLTEIHRQAKESPILRMATDIREGRPLSLGEWGDDCWVLDEPISAGQAKTFHQIIVGRNKTRHYRNERMRMMYGFNEPLPMVGDKLVCRRNNHDTGLLNGATYYVEDILGHYDEKMLMRIRPEEEGRSSLEVLVHEHFFINREDQLAWFQMKEAEKFEYGFAITCHVAQGSQWDRVLIFDESGAFRQDASKWLYTAVTRAAKNVTILRL
jgi:exodeoxyribonuclease-5